MTRLTADTVLQRRPDVLTTEIPDGYLVLDTTSFNCLSFVGSAGRIWDLLAEPVAVTDICGQLRREYRVDPAVCLDETLAHLEKLVTGGLVQVGDAAA
jgi:hypothetical protein